MGRSGALWVYPLGTSVQLFLLLGLSVSSIQALSSPQPRVFLPFQELQKTQSFEHYSLSEKAMDYRILFTDEDQDRMYVGCKDHILSMDINNISQATLKVKELSKALQINMKQLHSCRKQW